MLPRAACASRKIAIWHEYLGMSADEIVLHILTLTLSDAPAALVYYFDHIEEIREEIRHEQEFVDDFQRMYPPLLHTELDNCSAGPRSD